MCSREAQYLHCHGELTKLTRYLFSLVCFIATVWNELYFIDKTAIHKEGGQEAIHYEYRTIHRSAKCNAADARCFGGITRKVAYEDTEDKGIYHVLRYINYKT